jgi:hypothetical protein
VREGSLALAYLRAAFALATELACIAACEAVLAPREAFKDDGMGAKSVMW